MRKIRIGLIIAIALLSAYGLRNYHHSPSVTALAQPSNNSAVSSLNRDPSYSIDQLTQANRVASYLQQYQRLPNFYITKQQARRQGWDPAKANLCQQLPGRAIGGDHFANREHRLPIAAGRQWYEADVNYQCGHRNSDRILYSSDGLIFLTTDHYRSFKRLP